LSDIGIIVKVENEKIAAIDFATATETFLKSNTRVVLSYDSKLVNVIGEMSSILPLKR
jgi:hypothetical protein